MGCYDYINEQQIKCFTIPNLNFPDEIINNHSCIYFLGGRFHFIHKNEEIPYQTFWYIYEKNFNIFDIYPEIETDDNMILIHQIRNGRNTGYLYIKETEFLDNKYKSLFSYPFYDINGIKYKINKFKELFEIKIIKQNRLKIPTSLNYLKDIQNFHCIHNYKLSKKEEQELLELEFQHYLAKNKFEEEINKNQQQLDKYILNSYSNKYSIYGALIYCLSNFDIKILLNPSIEFFLKDERLLYLLAYKEYNSLSKEINEKQYIQEFNIDIQELEERKETILNKYKEVLFFMPDKTKFNEQYVLKDVLNGKYKDYYNQLNILPYKDFSLEIWN